MKMDKNTFNLIKERIDTILDNNPGLIWDYENGNFPLSEKVKDLNKRFRWDLLYESRKSVFDYSEAFENLDDTHIDTALQYIVPKITRVY